MLTESLGLVVGLVVGGIVGPTFKQLQGTVGC